MKKVLLGFFNHPNFKVLLILATVGGVSYYTGIYMHNRQENNFPNLPEEIIEGRIVPKPKQSFTGVERPYFSMKDLQGVERSIGEWDDKVLLINFWATWCPPCRAEMPGFQTVRDELAEQNLEIVGIAIDNPEDVQAFVDQLSITYPILVGAAEGQSIARQYGNLHGGLPYSVIVNLEGEISDTIAGAMTENELKKRLQPYLSAPSP